MAARLTRHLARRMGGRSKVRRARFSATLICGTLPLRNGSSGRRKTWCVESFLARRAIGLAVNENFARSGRALPCEDFDQFALAVARDARDADNFAFMNRKIQRQ